MTSNIALIILKSRNTFTQVTKKATWRWWSSKRGCQSQKNSENSSRTGGCAVYRASRVKTHLVWTRARRAKEKRCTAATARSKADLDPFSIHGMWRQIIDINTSHNMWRQRLSISLLSSTSMTSKRFIKVSVNELIIISKPLKWPNRGWNVGQSSVLSGLSI